MLGICTSIPHMLHTLRCSIAAVFCIFTLSCCPALAVLPCGAAIVAPCSRVCLFAFFFCLSVVLPAVAYCWSSPHSS